MAILKNAMQSDPDRDYKELITFKDLEKEANKFEQLYLKNNF
jgi:hypothetical protein